MLNERDLPTRITHQRGPVMNVTDPQWGAGFVGARGDGLTASAAHNTAAIQQAMDAVPASGGVVYVPRADGAYYVDPDTSLKPKSNTVVHIEKGATLRAIGVSSNNSAVLYIDNRDNVQVMGGGRIIGERDTHDVATNAHRSTTLTAALSGGETSITVASTTNWATDHRNLTIVANDGSYHHSVYDVTSGTTLALTTPVPAGFTASIGNTVYDADGEGGMCIRIENSTNVTVRDIECTGGWGDGIYITEYERSTDTGSKWILLDNVRCHGNRRNNLSIVGGRYVTVRGGVFRNASGAQPGHGIDIEPSATYECDDITIDGALCQDNARDGIRVLGPATVRNRILNCSAVGNGQKGISIFGSDDNLVAGCTARANGHEGFYVTNTGAVSANRNRILNCSAMDNSRQGFEAISDGGAVVNNGVLAGLFARGNVGAIYLENVIGWIVTGNVAIETGGSIQTVDMLNCNNCEVMGNVLRNGLQCLRMDNCDGCRVGANSIRNSLRAGMALIDSSYNQVAGNLFKDNASETHNTYDQLSMSGDSDGNQVVNNMFRGPSSGNAPRYAINVAQSTCNDNLVVHNDMRTGYTSGTGLNDNGTGTITTLSGNQS